jgi:hypothetical protein
MTLVTFFAWPATMMSRCSETISQAAEKLMNVLGDFAFVIMEEDLANEELGAQFDCSLENGSNTSQAKKIVLRR